MGQTTLGDRSAGIQRFFQRIGNKLNWTRALSPLGWEHINLIGDYVWRQSRKLEDGKFRPLRQLGKP
ncbi:TnpA transposase [Pseudomonas chlororaphis]|uniref:TnpA transposase n=1 Tax=Pseudomonas chlororaphis TaxID=587753 RepID=A0A3G7TPK0_9PSED|nr:TnpA transposase [Pseudomonas chlororaphis]